MKKSLLFIGVIIAMLVLVTHSGFSKTGTSLDKAELEVQTHLLAMDIVKELDEPEAQDTRFKVFNTNDQLIYETGNVHDEKLNQLLRSSDFVTEVNTISYYKLSR